MPSFEQLRENTFVAFADLDASPTKAWVVTHRDENREFYDYAVGRRPKYELFDVQADPHCMNNLADDAAKAGVRKQLHDRLMDELKGTGDPRVSDDVVFEEPPFTDGFQRRNRKANPKSKCRKLSACDVPAWPAFDPSACWFYCGR